MFLVNGGSTPPAKMTKGAATKAASVKAAPVKAVPAKAVTKAKPAAKATTAPAAAAKPAKVASGVRRFVFQRGGSNKFWTVSTKGSTVSVTFGRVGTAGQTKDKAYASGGAAIAAMQKLVAEKTGKGYVEA